MNVTRRQELGLGKTAAGGSGGSFAAHEREGSSPPPVAAPRLSTDELYALNDDITAELSGLGWSAETEDDYDALNDLVHEVAEASPAQRKELVQKFAEQGNVELLERVQARVTGQDGSAQVEYATADLGEFERARRQHYIEEVGSLFDEDPDSVSAVYELEADERSLAVAAAAREYDDNGGQDLTYDWADQYDAGIDGFTDGADNLSWVVRDDVEREHLYDSYYGAAFFTTPIETEDGSDSAGYFRDEYDEEQLSDELRDSMKQDLAQFITANRGIVNEYLQSEKVGADRNERMAQLGHDFWMTRNGHGVGFWDRGLGGLGQQMTDASKTFGSVDLYVGDDGKVYGQ